MHRVLKLSTDKQKIGTENFLVFPVTFPFLIRLYNRGEQSPRQSAMDYKYIEQLLERYWAAETTHEEEGILRVFFSQKVIPAELEQYCALFDYEAEEAKVRLLDEDFDAHILTMIEEKPQTAVRARQITFKQRLTPLFKAAAIVAIILTVGGALQRPWDASWNDPHVDYSNNYSLAVDSADATPIQAENRGDIPADSMKVIPLAITKD